MKFLRHIRVLGWPAAFVFGALMGPAVADALYQIGAFAPLMNPTFPTANFLQIGANTNTTTPARVYYSDLQQSGNVLPSLIMNWNGPGVMALGPSSSSGSGNTAKFRISAMASVPTAGSYATWDTTKEVDLEVPKGQIISSCFAVASLPTGATGGMTCVNNQTTSCPAKGSTFTGGGSVTCPAFFNGTSWVSP